MLVLFLYIIAHRLAVKSFLDKFTSDWCRITEISHDLLSDILILLLANFSLEYMYRARALSWAQLWFSVCDHLTEYLIKRSI